MAESIVLLADGSYYSMETADGIVVLAGGASIEDEVPVAPGGLQAQGVQSIIIVLC